MICATARFASAHGTPILVGQSENALTVSGGLSDSEGFATQIFVEEDEDGDPQGTFTLPNVGPVILWQIPGYDIAGLNNSASLSIEVLARPAKDSSPLEERVVWYWSPSLEEVLPSTADIHLLGTGMRFVTLAADEHVAPPPFQMAANLTGQQGFHNHGLLSYGLDNDAPRPAGAYGFFARLLSDQYEESDPFLIVFNHGMDYEQMVDAALAINAAADEAESLPGDFNHDGTVDAADYIVWRKTLPADGGYPVWQANFGRTLIGEGASDGAATVPEPATAILFACVIGSIATVGSRRTNAAELRS
jgi:hypothetical protein